MSDEIFDILDEPKPKPRQRKGGLDFGSVVLLMGIVAVGIVVVVQLFAANAGRPEGQAPDFPFTTFDGQEMRLSDFRGQVVMLNFWASWCAPCRDEAPELQSAWEHYADTGEVVFLGIAYADNGPQSIAYMDEYDITYLNAPDLGTRISDVYGITGVPETYVIDQEGNIAQFFFAGVGEADLRAVIDPLLGGGTASEGSTG